MLVNGVEIHDRVKGKYLPNIPSSDEKTGESLDPEIYFKRNGILKNQFNFFKNAAPLFHLFAIVMLPDGFSTSKDINDFDGLSKNLTPPS